MTTTLIVLAVLAVVIVLWFAGTYNGLVRFRNEVRNAWSQIDVQLKRRHDLVPNLVETVKGYAKHEKQTLEAVVNARANATAGSASVAERAQAEGELSQALSKLLMIVEQYPDLKANQNFLALQEELTSTENKLSFARQFYNDTVLKYNTKVQQIPANIVAGMTNFKAEEFFELEDKSEKENPQVKF